MNVLSLFDGIGCTKIALRRAGVQITNYYKSEIDKYTSAVSRYHDDGSDTELGDVTKYEDWGFDWSSIDLVVAGFPCQSWSISGQMLGDKDPRGMLFWTTLEVISKVMKANPKAKFLMENVKMKKDFEEYITYHTTNALGSRRVYKHLINSSLVSAQNRNRYYWTNIEGITQPEDKNILLEDILVDGMNKICAMRGRYDEDKKVVQQMELRKDSKSNTLTTVQKDNYVVTNLSASKARKSYTLTASYNGAVAWNSCQKKQRTMIPINLSEKVASNVYQGVEYRKLYPIECERLQTVSDNYTAKGIFKTKKGLEVKNISNTQRYKMLGNGFTVDIIAHILKNI